MHTNAGTEKSSLRSLFHKIRKSGKRQKLTMLSAAFVVYILLLSGIFAYFHSNDMVTNRLTAPNGEIAIQEPLWDSKGVYKASASEPGMTIEKDPSGINKGQVDVYIRLKMSIELESYKGNLTGADDYDNGIVGIPSDAKRRNIICHALKLENDTELFDMDTSGAPDTWTINSCENSSFIMRTAEEDNVFYFYYTAGNTGDIMQTVKSGEATDVLFDHLDIPVYKKDYLGVFDQKYHIILEAEGIPVGDDTNITVNEAETKFS